MNWGSRKRTVLASALVLLVLLFTLSGSGGGSERFLPGLPQSEAGAGTGDTRTISLSLDQKKLTSTSTSEPSVFVSGRFRHVAVPKWKSRKIGLGTRDFSDFQTSLTTHPTTESDLNFGFKSSIKKYQEASGETLSPTGTGRFLAPSEPTRKPTPPGWVDKEWYSRWAYRGPLLNITNAERDVLAEVQGAFVQAEEHKKKSNGSIYQGSQLSGALFVADGKGGCDQVDVPAPSGGDRLPSPLFNIIRKTAASNITQFTIIHVGFEDNCVYWPSVRFGVNASAAQWVNNMTDRFPMLYWVHWNPTLVSESEGRIGKRVVPIPHYWAVQRGNRHGSPPWSQRKKAIVWRGTTTGWERPFNTSDRWKVVNAFRLAEEAWEAVHQKEGGNQTRRSRLREGGYEEGAVNSSPSKPTGEAVVSTSSREMFNSSSQNNNTHNGNKIVPQAQSPPPPLQFWANVKFYSRAQGVTMEEVPDSFMGSTIDKESQSASAVSMDIDGNGNSWEGLRWKILGGGAIIKIKSNKFIQWYYPLLVNGLHLLNVDLDVQDLVEIARDLLDDDELGERLSVNAGAFGQDHLTINAAADYCATAIKSIWEYSSPNAEVKDWRIQMKFNSSKHFVASPTAPPPPTQAPDWVNARDQFTADHKAGRYRWPRERGN